jgi:hypothetical protein
VFAQVVAQAGVKAMVCIYLVRNIMKIVFSLIVLPLGFFTGISLVHSNSAPQGDCLRLTAEFDLLKFEDPKTGKQKGVLDAGDGLTLVFAPAKMRKDEHLLTLQDQGKKIKTLGMRGLFSACFRLEADDIKYWVVEGWDRGVHCCFSHLYFCRPGEGLPVRVLDGVFLGHSQTVISELPLSKAADQSLSLPVLDGVPRNLTQEQIICRNSHSYIKYIDNRFAYGMDGFKTSYVDSMIMFFPVFYRLSPKGLKPSNELFKEEYQRRIVVLDNAIREKGTNGSHFTTKKDHVGFYSSDDLGFLIIARTINYLLAREDSLAWETLKRDVQEYYGTTNGLEKLKKQIKATMAENAY